MDTNYFVCTLGEAVHAPSGRPYHSVNHLIEQQSKQNPDLPAIGFYRLSPPSSKEVSISPEILTFKHVWQGIVATAERLERVLDKTPSGGTIGLLCASSPEFFFTWLSAIWLGHPVLLIAPQCSPTGIASLCRSCEVSLLLVDEKHEQLGGKASQQELDGQRVELRCVRVPVQGDEVFANAKALRSGSRDPPSSRDASIAYLHHTSGTSSGLPKPIPQSQRGAVAVLPALHGQDSATFTTTPLYHGGPADIFRAWTSNAMTWLFPSQSMPVTSSNVIRCLEVARKAADSSLCAPVKYFTSVPYILQMMAGDEAALRWLQGMDLVGVGGAALPQEVGDKLVQSNVNLVSRFGSAECGFVLSSHREYDHDKYWQHLRVPFDATQLRFEEREDGSAELVILSDWPHMAKRTRPDQSYATSDLFRRHPKIENAWKYDSRADSQLTLITGKKFDPAPVEDAITAATPLIADTLVFGNDQPYPGALVFRSAQAKSMADDDFIQQVAPLVERLNAESQSHSQIPRSMLIPMAYADKPLEKSSKGTVIRNQAEATYAANISDAYESKDNNPSRKYSDAELPDAVRNIIQETVSDKSGLTNTTDLFSFGVDSVAGMQIRSKLRRLLPKDAGRLPVNVVEDCGTVDNLAKYLQKLRKGTVSEERKEITQDRQYMLQLVDEYSKFDKQPGKSHLENGTHDHAHGSEIVVLTGATGALGAHVLDQCRGNAKIARVYCLVRGSDPYAARERVSKALAQRKLAPLDEGNGSEKIIVLQSVLSDSQLGLEVKVYKQLAREATIILHLAWAVNFRMKLRSFVKDSISSVHNLINLALASSHPQAPRFAFCSSVASAMAHTDTIIPEAILSDPAAASISSGYSQSKWVAEQICARANVDTRLRGRVSVFRVGQLSGDSKTGIWNAKEAFPMMLGTVKLTKSLPMLQHEVLDWLPVDIAATAMLQGALLGQAQESAGKDSELHVYHVLNPHTRPQWRDMLAWLKKKVDVEILEPEQWVQRLETAAENGSDHPALQLLDFWRTAYANPKETDPPPKPTLALQGTQTALPVLSHIEPVDEVYFGRLWEWIEASF